MKMSQQKLLKGIVIVKMSGEEVMKNSMILKLNPK
jgi:hypothetical protein